MKNPPRISYHGETSQTMGGMVKKQAGRTSFKKEVLPAPHLKTLYEKNYIRQLLQRQAVAFRPGRGYQRGCSYIAWQDPSGFALRMTGRGRGF
jgi:hypothetical protein